MSRWIDALATSMAKSSGFVHEIETGLVVPFAELWHRSFRWDSQWAGKRQAFVSVILPNGATYLEVYLSVLRTGNIFNPIPYFISPQELAGQLAYVEPHAIVSDRDDIAAAFGGTCRFVDPAQLGEVAVEPVDTGVKPLDSDIACLYYSSGTTGNPKGVLYSHGNIFELISSINRGFGFDETVRQFAFLPFGHTASINYNIHPALLSGAPLFVSKGFEYLRGNFFQVLADHGIGYTEIVPSVLLMLLKLKHDVTTLDLSALKFVGCGSSTLPLESQEQFMEMYGLKVANLYGLSETGPSHIDDPNLPGWKPGSIGVPLDVNACRINDDGEILLKGANVFVGYYRNDSLYHEVVKDGWFHTGDLGYEENGIFYFADRKKDLIIKSGINIVPAEVEEAIYHCPDILECVVVGKPDPVHGENVVAAVALKDPAATEGIAKKVRDVCKARLTNYKVPVEIRVVDAIPKTHSGKLLRKKIRELFAG